MRKPITSSFLGVFVGLLGWFGEPRVAEASSAEQLIQVVVHPSDPQTMVLRFLYGGDGLLYSRDGGASFSLLCGSMVGAPHSADMPKLQNLGPIGIAGDGRVMIGVFGGLWLDDGQGCNWSPEPTLIGRWVTDIAAHPTDREVSFLITSNGGEVENGVIRRNADGTFTELGEKKAMLIRGLRVTALPDGSMRFYESAVLGQVAVVNEQGQMTTKPSYAVRVSDDEGETWTEHELGVLDGFMELEAVDPSNPDRIVISIRRDVMGMVVPDSVLVSEDQGATFVEWLQVTAFGAIAFSSDGEVWVGDAGQTTAPEAPRGIHHAASLAASPEVLADDFPVSCLHYTGDSLFACDRRAFGTVSLEDGELTPTLTFSQVETMLDCAGLDSAAVCRQQLCEGFCKAGHFSGAPMCQEAYGTTHDAGCPPIISGVAGSGGTAGMASGGAGSVPDDAAVAGGAGADARMDAGEASASSGGCGCTIGAASSSKCIGFATLALMMLLLAVRRWSARSTAFSE
jgi:hypothetical protein